MEPHYGTVSVRLSRFREVLLCCNAYRCTGAAMPRRGPSMHQADLFPLEKVAEGGGCKSTSPDLTWLSSASAVEKAIQEAERQEGKKHTILYCASLMLVLVPSMHINMVSSSLGLLPPLSDHICSLC